MPPENENRPAPAPVSHSGKVNPTPLDVLFIFVASSVLLLFLLWIAATVLRLPLSQDLLGLLKSTVSEVWKQVIVGTAGAGTAILALRQFLFKSRPSLNYMIWVPVTTLGLMLGLVLALFVVKQSSAKTPPPDAFVRVPIRFGAEVPDSVKSAAGSALSSIKVKVDSPETDENQYEKKEYGPTPGDNEFPYHLVIDMPTEPAIHFKAEVNPIFVEHWENKGTPSTWLICLKANPHTPFPAPDPSGASSTLIKLKCLASSNCPRTTTEPGPAIACDEQASNNTGLVRPVYAAEPNRPAIEPGWVVPSLDSLNSMADSARPGYTRFDVKFTAEGKAKEADHYFYAVRVNGHPVYIDGFLPDRTMFPLQKGTNWMSFALGNLDFTGEDNGYENLHLAVTFLKDRKVIDSVELDRYYVALRGTEKIPVVVPDPSVPEWSGKYPKEAGGFEWNGQYVAPTSEDKFEILVGSSECHSPSDQVCLKNAMRDKKEFYDGNLKYEGKIGGKEDNYHVVVKVRPPLRKPPEKVSYGYALGLVLPTRQVKFTFSAPETDQLCHWATQHYGQGAAGKIIQKDKQRYNVAKPANPYGPCV